MPRYPGGDYYLPPGTISAPDTTIESTKYNVFTADVETELNAQIDKDAAQDAALASGLAGINASTVPFAPAGDIVATNVQAAIVEVDTEMHAADATLTTAVATAQTAADNANANANNRVLKAGDIMTGDLTITKDIPALVLNKAATSTGQNQIFGYRNGVNRWLLRPGNDAVESGTNVGSDFDIHRYNNDGSYIGQSLNINRPSGRWTIGGGITCNAEQVINGSGIFVRMRQGGSTPSTFLYADATNFYFLISNAGDPDGSFGGLRPFYFNLSNGNVQMNHAVNISGNVTANFGTLTNGWDATCVNSTVNYGANSGIRIMGSQDAFMSFHRLSGFAANFGLGNDNSLRFGGWSHGSNYWLVWTERHCGYPFSQGRILFAGDIGFGSGMQEAANTVFTGMDYGGGLHRCRYVQMYTNGWVTINHA